jgi:predicted nucleic acid-binding protein
MQLVLDTNILVASLIRKGSTRAILFSKEFELFSPDNIAAEVLRNKEEYKQKSSTTEDEFNKALELELENIAIIPIEEYSSFKKKALSLCPKGHEDDWPFIAVALRLNCPLWSNDMALKKQSRVRIYSTAELLDAVLHD